MSILLTTRRIFGPAATGAEVGDGATTLNVERRATVRLVNYWLSLRRTAAGPWLADLRPERNPINWDRCSLAFSDTNGQMTWEHVGAEYAQVFAIGPADMPASDGAGSRFTMLFGRIEDVLASHAPSEREGRYQRADGRDVLYRSVVLPFIDRTGRPAYALVAFSYAFASSANSTVGSDA